jgi:hypothetical protein
LLGTYKIKNFNTQILGNPNTTQNLGRHKLNQIPITPNIWDLRSKFSTSRRIEVPIEKEDIKDSSLRNIRSAKDKTEKNTYWRRKHLELSKEHQVIDP